MFAAGVADAAAATVTIVSVRVSMDVRVMSVEARFVYERIVRFIIMILRAWLV